MKKIAYGYCRISSTSQNEERQLIAMEEIHVPRKNIYIDRQSGKDFERPEYKKLMKKLNSHTILYIPSIDRLGRNYTEIQEQWRIISKEKKSDIVVLDMPLLDTRKENDLVSTFLSDVVLQLLSFVAENERCNIRERQAQGIAAAKSRGVKFGRPQVALPDNFEKVYLKWKVHEISVREAAQLCGMSKSTFYDKAKQLKL